MASGRRSCSNGRGIAPLRFCGVVVISMTSWDGSYSSPSSSRRPPLSESSTGAMSSPSSGPKSPLAGVSTASTVTSKDVGISPTIRKTWASRQPSRPSPWSLSPLRVFRTQPSHAVDDCRHRRLRAPHARVTPSHDSINRPYARCSATSSMGSRKRKVVPSPTVLSTSSVRSWSSRIVLAMARPRPAPPRSRSRLLSTR